MRPYRSNAVNHENTYGNRSPKTTAQCDNTTGCTLSTTWGCQYTTLAALYVHPSPSWLSHPGVREPGYSGHSSAASAGLQVVAVSLV